MTPLSFIAQTAFRSERTIAKRFRNADAELARLKREGLVDYHDDACTAVHVTCLGRAALRRQREAAALKGAA